MTEDHSNHYTKANFTKKVSENALKAGKEVIEKSLYMYEALQDADTPKWAKTTIIGALGYLISPIDAIPDFTPVAGYTDDLTVLAGAFVAVAAHINDTHKEKAKLRLSKWFK